MYQLLQQLTLARLAPVEPTLQQVQLPLCQCCCCTTGAAATAATLFGCLAAALAALFAAGGWGLARRRAEPPRCCCCSACTAAAVCRLQVAGCQQVLLCRVQAHVQLQHCSRLRDACSTQRQCAQQRDRVSQTWHARGVALLCAHSTWSYLPAVAGSRYSARWAPGGGCISPAQAAALTSAAPRLSLAHGHRLTGSSTRPGCCWGGAPSVEGTQPARHHRSTSCTS